METAAAAFACVPGSLSVSFGFVPLATRIVLFTDGGASMRLATALVTTMRASHAGYGLLTLAIGSSGPVFHLFLAYLGYHPRVLFLSGTLSLGGGRKLFAQLIFACCAGS